MIKSDHDFLKYILVGTIILSAHVDVYDFWGMSPPIDCIYTLGLWQAFLSVVSSSLKAIPHASHHNRGWMAPSQFPAYPMKLYT